MGRLFTFGQGFFENCKTGPHCLATFFHGYVDNFDKNGLGSQLPDGLFSNQKSQFG
jgi:hypothetical protein